MSKMKRVVLYKHGVAHFERESDVTGDAEVRLSFRAEEMNDVLKSLTVYDRDGGVVSSISYDNKKPLSKLLADVSLDLPDSGGSVGILGALRGASVSVSIGSRTVSGQIVGIDTRVSQRGEVATERHLLTLFDEQGRMQTFDLDETTNIAFLDESLRDDIRFLFATVFSAKKQDAKTLKIFSRGTGERVLNISYVVECPVWKTSYRIAVPGEVSDAPSFLQGWALVDNPQDEDWTDVSLSLVSGLPVSFRHDLYSPRYLSRQEVAVETESSAGLFMAEGSMFDKEYGDHDEALFDMPAVEAVGAAPDSVRRRAALAPAALSKPSAKVETVTQKTGQLFEYKIDRPVTVLRNQSALVPIVNGSFEGGKKLLYNESKRAENPYAVVDFKNRTGLTLEGGPVTVFEGEIYAGEAMLDTMGPEEEVMLPYAVALDVEVVVERKYDTRSLFVAVERGIWRHQEARYTTTEYRLLNRGESTREVIVEHKRSEAELVNTPEPTDETRGFWRFSRSVEAGGKDLLMVREKQVLDQSFGLGHLGSDQVLSHLSRAASGAEDTALIKELRALSEQVQSLLEQSSDLDNQARRKVAEQERIRKNLAALGDSQEERSLRSRYVNQLDADENELESLGSEVKILQEKHRRAEQAFRERVQSVTLKRIYEE